MKTQIFLCDTATRTIILVTDLKKCLALMLVTFTIIAEMIAVVAVVYLSDRKGVIYMSFREHHGSIFVIYERHSFDYLFYHHYDAIDRNSPKLTYRKRMSWV